MMRYQLCTTFRRHTMLNGTENFGKLFLFCEQIVLAVSRRIDSPMAMGLTSPFGLGRAISLEEEKRVAATSGNIPLANAEQAEKRPSAVSSFSGRILKCSKRQPLGPAPDQREACLIESKSNDLDKLIDSQLTLGAGGRAEDLGGCLEINFLGVSSVDGARPLLVRILGARDNSPHLTSLRAAAFLALSPVVGDFLGREARRQIRSDQFQLRNWW